MKYRRTVTISGFIGLGFTFSATSQIAFITYRDTGCQRRYDATLGGGGAGDFIKACQIELTGCRIQQLQAE